MNGRELAEQIIRQANGAPTQSHQDTILLVGLVTLLGELILLLEDS